MTPAERLAAARSNVVGPYVPAREEWLRGVVVPAVTDTGRAAVVFGLDGGRGYWFDIDGYASDFGDAESLRLDLRRPEVRDLLIRRGAPAWARELSVALWVWASIGGTVHVCRPWGEDFPGMWWRHPAVHGTYTTIHGSPTGWAGAEMSPGRLTQGPETGPEGRAFADLAALSRGCILEEAGGWLLPLPDGGIGFWPREGA